MPNHFVTWKTWIVMDRFSLPNWIQKHYFSYNPALLPFDKIETIKSNLKRFQSSDPEVSIVIPAYNEENSLLNTLSSVSDMETNFRTELIVANNNSTDRTQEILDACGVRSVFVKDQGISYARQGGLDTARGKYVLNADSDSIYPRNWINNMVNPLYESGVSCVYGTYSFIPSPGNSRMFLAFYEVISESFFKLKKINRECVNVMGFTFAFRKADAQAVGGFKHDLCRSITGRSEDGWMALQLMKKGGLYQVTDYEARVWTSDRRLMADGSLSKAFQNRVVKEFKRLNIYINQKHAPGQERNYLN